MDIGIGLSAALNPQGSQQQQRNMTVTVKNIGNELGPAVVKSREMMIRELVNRIYQLMCRCITSRGKSLAQILTVVERKHHQYLFDRIYKHIHNRYFESLYLRTKNPRHPAYLIQEKDTFFMKSLADLWEVFELLGISSNYHDIPFHLRKFISRKTFEKLVDDIPRARILYEDRYTPTPYHFNRIETRELHKVHPDGNPIPFDIKHIYVHKIYKFHGSCVKIWELVPRETKRPTPVCLIPGFGSNYFSFHFMGNESIDYHLVKAGSRVFVLDHDRKDEDANVDVYTEYLITTMLDFVRERTSAPQVILGGHSMGGLIAICKTILDAVRRPRFVTSVKALFLINSPIHFDENYFVPSWVVKAGQILFDIIGNHGTVPVSGLARMAIRIPFARHIATADIGRPFSKLQQFRLLEYNRMLQWIADLQGNPFSDDPKALKTLAERAVTNPPRMVVEHMGLHIKNHVEGFTSFNYEELSIPTYEGEEWEVRESAFKRKLGINYTQNIYRISPSIPLLTIQNKDDVISPPQPFYKFWGRWAHRHKLRLDDNPNDPESQRRVIRNMQEFIRRHGLSTAIGVTVRTGRHMMSLDSQKELISAFIDTVDEIPFVPLNQVQIGLDSAQRLIQREHNDEIRFIAESDLAKKIRYIDPHLFWTERTAVIKQLLLVLATFVPSALVDEQLEDFVLRDKSKVEDKENIKYNLLINCVHAILQFRPEPLGLIGQIFTLVKNEDEPPPPPCFRSLQDLALGLFEYSKNGLPEKHRQFVKQFMALIDYSLQSPERSVVMHALRTCFATQDHYFIRKGGEVCSRFSLSWQTQAYQIYWEEVQRRIRDLQDAPVSTLHVEMKPYMLIAKHISPTQLTLPRGDDENPGQSLDIPEIP